MPALKRPAAAHTTTTQGSTKRSRTSIESTNDYEAISCIGEGGSGLVLEALHCATGNTVAIKFLSPPDPDDDVEEPPEVAELLSEARSLEACSGNPYVIGFQGLVRHPTTGELGLVMEHVAAPSLHAFLRRGPPLTEPTIRAFMRKLLTGAKMMHARHLVHRDIKPRNILVDDGQGIIKICDLGLAISLSSQPPPYAQAGTRGYMAPEMLLQRPDYDAQVDAWSLGCVMAEMLTGGGKTLFLGQDDDDEDEFFDDEMLQLGSIFRVLGTPDEKTWPGFASLPLTAKAMQLLPAVRHGHHSRLREIFPEEKLSEQGFEVLQGLLTCNPDKRLTATKALKHTWFADPRPAAAKVDAFAKKAPRIKFIPPAIPEKITFKVPLAQRV
ncbi:unnamed protein product [Alopecurus aequalis]